MSCCFIRPQTYGPFPEAPFRFPNKYPESVRDYTYRIPCPIDPTQDFVQSASVEVAPWGDGEITIVSFAIVGTSFTIKVSGGQPRQLYTYNFVVTMANGRVFEFVFIQDVLPLLPTDWPQPIVNPGFGPPVTWNVTTGFFAVSPSLFWGV